MPVDRNVPPASCKELTTDGAPCGIRAVATSSTSVCLFHFSAKHCFPAFLLHELIELINLSDIPVDAMLSTKGEATHVCIKYFLPLAETMEPSNAPLKRLPSQSVLTQEAIDTLVDEAMLHDAKAELMGATNEH